MNQVSKDEALKLALEALESYGALGHYSKQAHKAITAIQQALEAPVQDAKELFGYEIWGCFYRTFDEALEAFKDKGIQWATSDGVFNGMNEEWVKDNIREVYAHGTPAIAKREAEAKKGQP
jgi:hypothetical protein